VTSYQRLEGYQVELSKVSVGMVKEKDCHSLGLQASGGGVRRGAYVRGRGENRQMGIEEIASVRWVRRYQRDGIELPANGREEKASTCLNCPGGRGERNFHTRAFRTSSLLGEEGRPKFLA